MPIERDDLATRIYGHNVKGLQFYDWDRVLQQEIYLQEDNTLNIGGEGVAAPSISAGAWLGDDGAGIFSFRPDLPVVVTSTAIVTEYPTIVSAISAAVSGETVAIPPGTYDESITLKDGVRIVELFTGTVIIDSVSADKAVITADGGYIKVKEIRVTRSRDSDGKLHAVFADHDTGMCAVVAELIHAENTNTVDPGETFGVTMWGAGTLWVFAERIEAFLDGYQHVFGVASDAGTSYIAAVQILADGGVSEDSLVYGVRGRGGEQYIWAHVEAQSEGTAWAGYCTFGEQHIWGDCVASGGAVRGAACEGGLQVIHGNLVAESTKGWSADAAHVQEGTQRIYGSCLATSTGTVRGARLYQDTNAGVQEIWGNVIGLGGGTDIGALVDGSAQAGAVTQRIHGDVIGTDYGAKCEEGTQTITGGRASGGTYDLWQTGGTLAISSVQYSTYSGTITLLTESINALIAELEDTTELTVAAGVVTVTQSYHRVDTQNDEATDDLDTVNGGVTGQILVLRPENDARTVVVKHNTGNIWNPSVADVTLDDVNDHVLLLYDGSKWCLLTYEGTVDHGALDGLADDDHAQYSLVDGTRAFTGSIEIDVPVGDPTIVLDTDGVDQWTLGVDDDDFDRFKINRGAALASPSNFELDTAGMLSLVGDVMASGRAKGLQAQLDAISIYSQSAALDLTTSFQDVVGCTTGPFTPSVDERALILAFFHVRQDLGTAPCNAADVCDSQVDPLTGDYSSVFATGGTGGAMVVRMYSLDMTASTEYTIKLQGRNATGNRGRATRCQMIVWRLSR